MLNDYLTTEDVAQLFGMSVGNTCHIARKLRLGRKVGTGSNSPRIFTEEEVETMRLHLDGITVGWKRGRPRSA